MYAGFFGWKDFAEERAPRAEDEGEGGSARLLRVEVRRRFERRLEGW